MSRPIVLSDQDRQKLQRAVDRTKQQPRDTLRRNPRLRGGGGGSNVRSAIVDIVGDTYLRVYLLKWDGDKFVPQTPRITVHCGRFHIGSNPLTGEVWPKLHRNSRIPIFADVDGKYYPAFMFDDVGPCELPE